MGSSPSSLEHAPAPDTSEQNTPPPCTLKPPTAHKEWDECIRQSVLTIGSTTVTAVVIAMAVPAAETLMLIGTGAGVLWSVKRCRTFMREGLLTPEEEKDIEAKKRAEKEEKARQRKVEKESKRKLDAEQKLSMNQKQQASKNNQLGTNQDPKIQIQDQHGVPLGNKTCKKPPQHNVKAQVAANSSHSSQMPDRLNNLEEGKSPKILIGDPEQGILQQLQSSGTRKQAKPIKHLEKKQKVLEEFSSVQLFAPHTSCTESVILACNSLECTCNAELNCTCDELPGELEYQNLRKGSVFETSIVQQVSSYPPKRAESKGYEDSNNEEIKISTEMGNLADGSSSKNTPSEQPVENNSQTVTLDSRKDDNKMEDDGLPTLERPDTKSGTDEEQSSEGFSVEVINNTEELVDQAEDVVLAEMHQSERRTALPFSFTLPSLDKFEGKKNSSFKWPPLTSSIIVKPKRESGSKCSSSAGRLAAEDMDKDCSCGSHEDDCSCPYDGGHS